MECTDDKNFQVPIAKTVFYINIIIVMFCRHFLVECSGEENFQIAIAKKNKYNNTDVLQTLF